jgi:predicted GNAT family acetyltransferase
MVNGIRSRRRGEELSATIRIKHDQSASGGRYEARVEGKDGTGELTYRRRSPATVTADSTRVDDSLRGTGVGKALIERLVADARADGFRIVPMCSFVKAVFERRPDWSDVKGK